MSLEGDVGLAGLGSQCLGNRTSMRTGWRGALLTAVLELLTGVSSEKGRGGGESGGLCLKKYLAVRVVVASSSSRLLSLKAEPLWILLFSARNSVQRSP